MASQLQRSNENGYVIDSLYVNYHRMAIEKGIVLLRLTMLYNYQNGIFHFDKNGKFLNKIGSKGQGPEEYLQGLFAFGDWKNKLLYVQNWTTLTCYGFDGTFVRSIPTPQLNMGAAGLFDENHILYSNDIYYADKANPIQLSAVKRIFTTA